MSKKRGRPRKAKPDIPIAFETVAVDDTTCTICFAEFLEPEDLQLHFDQVHEIHGGIIKCGFCVRKFLDAEQYAMHLRNEHITKISACKLCFRCFLDRDECVIHEKRHKTSIPNTYSCSNCKDTFNLMKELEIHEYETHRNSYGVFLHEYYSLLSSVLNIQIESLLKSLGRDTAYVCQKCTYSNSDLSRYINHLIKSNCRSEVCDKCFYVYSSVTSLTRHLVRSKTCRHGNKEDVYKNCPKCSKKVLHTVYSEHTSICKAVKCQHCDLILQSGVEFAEHFSKNHPVSMSVQCCQFCNKYFSGSEALNKHFERIHKQQLPLYKYKCDDCNSAYKHPRQLFTHFNRAHPDIKPFTCKICDKSYKLRPKFTVHIKVEHKGIGTVRFTDKSYVIFEQKQSMEEKNTSNDLSDENKDKTEPTSEIVSNENNSEKTKELDNELSVEKLPEKAPSEVDNNELLSNENNPEQVNKQYDTNEISNEKEPLKLDNENEMLPIEKDPQKTKELNEILPNENNSDKASSELDNTNEKIAAEKPPEVPSKIDKKAEEENSKNDYKVMTRKRKLKSNQQISLVEFLESDSEDEPLVNIAKKSKRYKKTKKRTNQAGLTCNICNQKCYTILNYKQHLAMHKKNQSQECIKCNASFKSVNSLKLHYAKAHSKSALTDTLKRLVNEKKKISENVKKPNLKKIDMMKAMFKNTIKKVEFQKSNAVATITEVKPNNSYEKKSEHIKINTSITIKKVVNNTMKPPSIKIYKFKPPKPLGPNIKLAMPTKCNIPPPTNEHKATITKVNITEITQPKLNISSKKDIPETFTLYTDYGDHHVSSIPEVDHEVMLGATDYFEVPKTPYTQKIIIPDVTNTTDYENIRIAHLLPEAPFYKIVTVKDILQTEEKETIPEPKKVEEKIELPSGTKLVNVNPLAHLLKNTNILEPTPPPEVKRKRKPKTVVTKNYQQAVAKALLKLEETAPTNQTRKRKRKENMSITHYIEQSDVLQQSNKDIDNLIQSISVDVANTTETVEQNTLVDDQRLISDEQKAVNEDAPTEIEYLEEFEENEMTVDAEINTGPGLSLPEL